MYNESYYEQFVGEINRVLALTKKGQRLLHNSTLAKREQDRLAVKFWQFMPWSETYAAFGSHWRWVWTSDTDGEWERMEPPAPKQMPSDVKKAMGRCARAYQVQQDWFKTQARKIEEQVSRDERKALEKRFGVLHAAMIFAKYAEWQINKTDIAQSPDAPSVFAEPSYL